MFETDAGGNGATSTTFVGIDAIGGTIPSANRFDIDAFPVLEQRIIAGDPLRGTITGDINGDGFVDAGHEYDVTLALENVFNLVPAASVIYTTRTVFGSGTPGAVTIPTPTVSMGPNVSQFEGDSGLTAFRLLRESLTSSSVSDYGHLCDRETARQLVRPTIFPKPPRSRSCLVAQRHRTLLSRSWET